MAKTIEKQFTEIITNEIEKVLGIVFERRFLSEIGKDVAKQIRTRTRLGKGVGNNGRQEKLAPLKKTTKSLRRRYRSRLSNLTTPARSNLTATGAMLDSISSKLNGKTIKIFIKNTVRRTLSGAISEKTNSEIATFLEKGRPSGSKGGQMSPRPFFKLTKSEENEIRRKIRDKVRKAL